METERKLYNIQLLNLTKEQVETLYNALGEMPAKLSQDMRLSISIQFLKQDTLEAFTQEQKENI